MKRPDHEKSLLGRVPPVAVSPQSAKSKSSGGADGSCHGFPRKPGVCTDGFVTVHNMIHMTVERVPRLILAVHPRVRGRRASLRCRSSSTT
ncbi:MAG: hypothetical protein KTR25_18890 [Myxococcales bacterium]|nr:hypothetical protein [Myxococcales bacterium]